MPSCLRLPYEMKFNIFHRTSSTVPLQKSLSIKGIHPFPRTWNFLLGSSETYPWTFLWWFFWPKILSFCLHPGAHIYNFTWDSQLYEFREVTVFIHYLNVKKIIGLTICQNNFVKYNDSISHPNYKSVILIWSYYIIY